MEARRGFFDAFNGQDLEAVTQGLGTDWDIVTDMAIKLMPGAHPFHAIAEAAQMAHAQGITADRVERVVITAPQLATWAAQAVAPTDLVSAAHSVPFFVATALLDGAIGWDLFEPAKMRNPQMLALLPRIAFNADPPPHPDRFGHRHGGSLDFELRDGRSIRFTCKSPRGSGARGIAWADVEAKYTRLLARAGVDDARAALSLAAVHGLVQAPNARSLLDQLVDAPEHARAAATALH